MLVIPSLAEEWGYAGCSIDFFLSSQAKSLLSCLRVMYHACIYYVVNNVDNQEANISIDLIYFKAVHYKK